MKIKWELTKAEIRRVQIFLRAHENSPLVLERVRKNLAKKKPPPTHDKVWRAMVG